MITLYHRHKAKLLAALKSQTKPAFDLNGFTHTLNQHGIGWRIEARDEADLFFYRLILDSIQPWEEIEPLFAVCWQNRLHVHVHANRVIHQRQAIPIGMDYEQRYFLIGQDRPRYEFEVWLTPH